ncbi:potassium channel family protein [Microbaculum marinum]|uniref:Potassium channel family protein n=1 Tax=Microbaculum marinum TaxID=1764581 RepID=A0AAW9RX77_9HYPH
MAKTTKSGTSSKPAAETTDSEARSDRGERTPWANLKSEITELYEGRSRAATRFRYGLLAFDVLLIVFFLLTVPLQDPPWLIALDVVIAIPLILDFLARFWIARKKSSYLLQVTTIADVLIIVSLLLPLFFDNLAFLRVIRTLRLLRSYHVMRDLRSDLPFVKRNEELLHSLVNLVVFVFSVTALVFVLEAGANPQIASYLDALYFTVATLTTTGFGDITLQDRNGRLLSVVIMVVGVALFLRLVQTVFRPNKVRHTCPDCGLKVHDPDAVHCKHCGRVLNIETEGHR